MNSKHVAYLFMLIGALVMVLALVPFLMGAPLEDVVNSMRGFWLSIGIAVFLVGMLVPRYK